MIKQADVGDRCGYQTLVGIAMPVFVIVRATQGTEHPEHAAEQTEVWSG